MAPPDAAQHDPIQPLERAPDNPRIDELEPRSVGADALVAREQRDGDGVEAEYLRPFLGDDMDEMIEAFRLDRRQHRLVDRGDRARMAAGEGDQILIGLLRRRHPGAQLGHRPVLEVDHLAHRAEANTDVVKKLRPFGLPRHPGESRDLVETCWDFSTWGPGFRRDDGGQPIFCPVFSQSARKASSPRSVSGCLKSWRMTAGGAVMTSAPIIADWRTWIGWRMLATRIWVSKS